MRQNTNEEGNYLRQGAARVKLESRTSAGPSGSPGELEPLIHTQLVEANLRGDFSVTMEQTPVVSSGLCGRASGIDDWELCNQ